MGGLGSVGARSNDGAVCGGGSRCFKFRGKEDCTVMGVTVRLRAVLRSLEVDG